MYATTKLNIRFHSNRLETQHSTIITVRTFYVVAIFHVTLYCYCVTGKADNTVLYKMKVGDFHINGTLQLP